MGYQCGVSFTLLVAGLVMSPSTPSDSNNATSVASPAPTVYVTVTPTAQSTPITILDATVIAADYNANAIAADIKYKDKVLIVRGIIDDIGTDNSGTPFVYFKTNIFCLIRCEFEKNQLDKLVSVTKGETIIIGGICEQYYARTIHFVNCRLP
jgi:hypothetical protein